MNDQHDRASSAPSDSSSDNTSNSSLVEKVTRPTRRTFLTQLGVAGLTVSTGQMIAQSTAAPSTVEAPAQSPPSVPGAVPVTLNVNGKEYRLRLDPRTTVLDTLREHLNLFGTKKGCDHGQCGACTLHINGRRVNSCLTFAVMHEGDKITTIEGLGSNGQLHPVQEAFVQFDGFQCGYCTPGQIMSGAALLNEPVGPDDDSVRDMMSGNLCRCGAYNNIVAAVQAARRKS